MTEITGIIEAWRMDQVTKEEFIIWGFIYNDVHGRWGNDTYFHTSGIKNRKCKQGDVVDTRNSRYELGASLADYKKGGLNEADT